MKAAQGFLGFSTPFCQPECAKEAKEYAREKLKKKPAGNRRDCAVTNFRPSADECDETCTYEKNAQRNGRKKKKKDTSLPPPAYVELEGPDAVLHTSAWQPTSASSRSREQTTIRVSFTAAPSIQRNNHAMHMSVHVRACVCVRRWVYACTRVCVSSNFC